MKKVLSVLLVVSLSWHYPILSASANEASAQIEMGDPIPCWYKERLAVRGEAHLGKERNRRSGADCQLPNSMKTGSTLSSSR